MAACAPLPNLALDIVRVVKPFRRLVAPQVLKPVFRAWTALGWVLGWINSRIIMSVVFYVIVTPTGVIMRLFGSDPMGRKFDPSCASYRVPSRQVPTQSMDRPF